MTAGNNGNPEDDDPYAYLYRHDGEGDAAGAVQGVPVAQPGVPRTSHHQVTRVGERQYGGQQQYAQPQPGGYGYPPQAPPQQQYQQPTAHHAAPPAHGGGGGGGNGGGPNNKGLLIGSIAVLAAVSIGIGVAVANGSDGEKEPTSTKTTAAATSPDPTGTSDPTPTATKEPSDEPLVDAASLPRAGGAKISDEWDGAKAEGGKYVDGMGTVGASVTWAYNAPEKGSYDLWLRYANAEKDSASATVATNGTALSWKIGLDNYGKEGDWTGWYRSYVTVELVKGANSVAIACGQGDTCHFNLDQIAMVKKGGAKPFE